MDQVHFENFTCSARQVEVFGGFSPPLREDRAYDLLTWSEGSWVCGDPGYLEDRVNRSIIRWDGSHHRVSGRPATLGTGVVGSGG